MFTMRSAIARPREKVPGKELTAYEAGPFPVWKVSACGLYQDKLLKEGYAPWRYWGMMENR